MPRSGERVLVAVLFTDIVDSTSIAAEIGDARWRVLLTRHHAIVRQELKRHGGELADTAGDGVFATFATPAPAIRCAVALVERIRQLGVEIRAGVHFGETERIDGKLGGIAVHTGARVMSAAGPGEVLVTSGTRELVAGAGFTFAKPGSHQLKGIDGAQQLSAVTSVGGVPLTPRPTPTIAHERLAAIEAPASSRRRRSPIAIGVGIVVLAASAFLLRPGHSDDRTIAGAGPFQDAAIQIDPTGRTVATVYPVGMDLKGSVRPQIAIGEAGVWVLDAVGVTHIDPGTSSIEQRVPIYEGGGVGTTPDVAVGAPWVWATGVNVSGGHESGALERIDAASNRLLLPIRFRSGGTATGVAVDDRFAWATLSSGFLEKVDGLTGQKLETIHLTGPADMVVAGEGAVWVGDILGSTVTRIDADSNHVHAPIELDGNVDALAEGLGAVWVLDRQAGTVTRIDALSGTKGHPIRVGSDPGDLAVGLGSVWVSSESEGTVWKVDSVSKETTSFVVGAPVAALAVDETGGTVWLLIRPSS